ncbi:MAG: hypothetical protein LBC41_00610, partial [Clostridiales bacterium]|nr:hypothetical protein [Clostridiales bacterium]
FRASLGVGAVHTRLCQVWAALPLPFLRLSLLIQVPRTNYESFVILWGFFTARVSATAIAPYARGFPSVRQSPFKIW